MMYTLIGLLVMATIGLQKSEAPPRTLSGLMSMAEQLEWEQPDSAIAIYRSVYSLALRQDSSLQQGLSVYYTSLVHMDQGRFDSAEYYLDKAADVFEGIDHKEYSYKVLNAQANNYQFSHAYDESILAYQRALDLAEEMGDGLNQARILSNQSSVFNMTGRIASAIHCLEKAEVLARPYGQTAILGDIYNNMANNHQSNRSYDSCIAYARKAIEIYHAVSDPRYEALALTNLAGYLHEQKPMDLNTSKECLVRSRRILDTLVAPGIEVNYWKHLSYYQYKIEAHEDAKISAAKCLEYLMDFPDLRSEATIYEILYSMHKASGNNDEALEFHERFFALRDSLIFQESRDQLQELEAKYQSTKKDNQISTQQLLVNQRTSQRNLLVLGLFSSIGLILFLVDRYRKNKKLALEKVQNLERQHKLLVMNSMLDGQEEERKRVAQDLHDGLGGLLSSARMQIKRVQREIDKLDDLKLIDRTEELIDHACKEVRRIAHNMMPGALMDLGFFDAIEDLINDIRLQHDLEVSLEMPYQSTELNDSVSVNLYRVIQEIFQNIQKHAQATKAHLTIDLVGSELMIHIADNGVGFDGERVSVEGLGLKGIQARVEYLNGNIHLDAAPNKGCSYLISVPLS